MDIIETLDGTITLDGRKFHGITKDLPANQEDYILVHLQLAGTLEALGDIDGVKRTTQERAEDLLTQILLSGQTHYLVAGCLTEEGKVWNSKAADANAARFAGITDIPEKTYMRNAIVQFVVGIFSARESVVGDFPSAEVPAAENAAPSTSSTLRH
jgi:hypothetical protein